jgi:hypothetical protein
MILENIFLKEAAGAAPCRLIDWDRAAFHRAAIWFLLWVTLFG